MINIEEIKAKSQLNLANNLFVSAILPIIAMLFQDENLNFLQNFVMSIFIVGIATLVRHFAIKDLEKL